MAIKERKKATTASEKNGNKKMPRTETKTYVGDDNNASAFVGINKYGLYMGLRDSDDKVEFINGYEVVGLLNTILEQFDSIDVTYSGAVSKNNKEYENAILSDFKI